MLQGRGLQQLRIDLSSRSQPARRLDRMQSDLTLGHCREVFVNAMTQSGHQGISTQIDLYFTFHLRFHALKNSGGVNSISPSPFTNTCIVEPVATTA